MYLLSIVVGNASVALMYQSEDTAKIAGTNLKANSSFDYVELADDFGQTAHIKADDLHGFIIEDLNQSKLARAEQMLHNARCQALAQKLGQTDASLRQMHGSPSVITPQMGPNGFRG